MVSIAGLVYGSEAAQGELARDLRNLLSPSLSPAIQMLLASPRHSATGRMSAAFGTIALFFGASSVLTEIRDALNTIWHVPAHRECTRFAGLFRMARERISSFAMILGFGILLLASLALSSWIGALATIFQWQVSSASYFFQLFISLISFAVIALVFSAVYKVIPDVDLTWRDVAMGGVATALLFIAGKQLISVYIARVELGSAYGVAGSLIVVLVWVYYSAQVFFFGAEFTKVYAETHGSRRSSKDEGEDLRLSQSATKRSRADEDVRPNC
jgi:membrane protein